MIIKKTLTDISLLLYFLYSISDLNLYFFHFCGADSCLHFIQYQTISSQLQQLLMSMQVGYLSMGERTYECYCIKY